MIQIVPAVLATNEDDYKQNVDKLNNADLVNLKWVHIDFMDNKFVPNKSIGSDLLNKHPLNNAALEAHLMVETPNIWIADLKQTSIKRAIAHIETGDEVLEDFIAGCKVADIEVGLSIKLDTPLEKLVPYLEVTDLVLVMSVDPGFQGRPFLPESLDRIKEIQRIRSEKGYDFVLAVDGAVNDSNAKSLVAAGADQLTVGSYLMKADNIEKNYQTLLELINS